MPIEPLSVVPRKDAQAKQPLQESNGEQLVYNYMSCAAELIVDDGTKTFSIVPVLPVTPAGTIFTDCSIERWESYIRVMRTWGICWEGIGGPMTMCHQPPSDIFADKSCPEPSTITIHGETMYYRRHPDLHQAYSRHIHGHESLHEPKVARSQSEQPYVSGEFPLIELLLPILWLLHIAVWQIHRFPRPWKYFRKTVPPGHQRLEWQCVCIEPPLLADIWSGLIADSRLSAMW